MQWRQVEACLNLFTAYVNNLQQALTEVKLMTCSQGKRNTMLYFLPACNIPCENHDYTTKVTFLTVCPNVIVEIPASYIGLKYGKYFNTDHHGTNLVSLRLLPL